MFKLIMGNCRCKIFRIVNRNIFPQKQIKVRDFTYVMNKLTKNKLLFFFSFFLQIDLGKQTFQLMRWPVSVQIMYFMYVLLRRQSGF